MKKSSLFFFALFPIFSQHTLQKNMPKSKRLLYSLNIKSPRRTIQQLVMLRNHFREKDINIVSILLLKGE